MYYLQHIIILYYRREHVPIFSGRFKGVRKKQLRVL